MLQILRDQGITGDPTPEDLLKVPHAERIKVYTAVSSDLKKRLPVRFAIYSSIQDDVMKREWLCHYFQDVEAGGHAVINETVRKTQRVEKLIKILLAEEQLSGPNFLNSKDHARIMVNSGELVDHPHWKKPLAGEGIKEYE